jgi:hypothetical protein
MIAIKLIQDVVMFERKLQIEEEQRRDRLPDSYVKAPQSSRKKQKNKSRSLDLGQERQPDCNPC